MMIIVLKQILTHPPSYVIINIQKATKEFTYCGDELYCNIESSARGSVRFTIICDGKEYESYETFGNSSDKRVHFLSESAIRKCKGKPVRLRIDIFDADLYSIAFR